MKVINSESDNTTLLEIDSTFCKVHQSACYSLKNQAVKMSRGSKNAKIYVLLNEKMQVLNVTLSAGHIHDSELAIELLKGVELKANVLLAFVVIHL